MVAIARMDTASAHNTPERPGQHFPTGDSSMRRATALCAAAGIAVSCLAIAAPAQAAGYYVIRWENTGICQIWNEDLRYKPIQWPSDYKVVSKPAPTFSDAMAVQLKMRDQRRCTL